MKKTILAIALCAILSACSPPTSNEKQSAQQETLLQEGTMKTGMPSIKNFRERKLLKDIFELRDQDGLVTYTYIIAEMTGKPVFICNSIGYGIPAATQYTSPMSVQTGTGSGYKLTVPMPQADPNGLFSPSSAEGTWVMCSDPSSGKATPVYIEPRVIVSPFKLQ